MENGRKINKQNMMITKIEWQDWEKGRPDLNSKDILHYFVELSQTIGFVQLPLSEEMIKRLIASFEIGMIRYWALMKDVRNFNDEDEYINEAKYIINLIDRANWENEDDN